MKPKTLIVISHYKKRPKTNLNNLLSQLNTSEDDVAVIINDDESLNLEFIKKYSGEKNKIYFYKRPNTGMNIGSWNAGFKAFNNYEYYIFLQDECKIVLNDFVKKYVYELNKSNIGMVGESINYKWDSTWQNIISSPLNYNIGFYNQQNVLKRIDYYFDCFKLWDIPKGLNGIHLRSLVWAFKKKILDQIGGFPIGTNKEECIAAEISVSKKVESLGLNIKQINEKPFHYIKHLEWKHDGTSKII